MLSRAPSYVQLDRAGSAVSAFQSPDGVHWVPFGTDTFDGVVVTAG